MAILLKIGARERRIDLPLDTTIHLGRIDPALDVFPEVDLTHYGPTSKSISRRHAAISRVENSIVVEDLGSVRGTYVNSERLAPFLPETLRDGDTLQVGKIFIKVRIKETSLSDKATHYHDVETS